MNNNFWTKITNYKLFNKTIFQKEEICSEINYEGQLYQIHITQDYFNSEFNIDNKKQDK